MTLQPRRMSWCDHLLVSMRCFGVLIVHEFSFYCRCIEMISIPLSIIFSALDACDDTLISHRQEEEALHHLSLSLSLDLGHSISLSYSM